MKIPTFAEGFLVEKTKLQGIHWQTDLSSVPKILALSPVVVDFGGSQSGNRCMAIFTQDACCTVYSWQQAISKIQQRYIRG